MILAPVQMTFHGCYAVGRQFTDSAVLYEWILRFKALASLAGRERNRMMQKNTVQPEASGADPESTECGCGTGIGKYASKCRKGL